MERAWARSCIDLGSSSHSGSWGALVSSGTSQGCLRPEHQTGRIAPCLAPGAGHRLGMRRPALVMSTLSMCWGLVRWHGIRAVLPPGVYCAALNTTGEDVSSISCASGIARVATMQNHSRLQLAQELPVRALPGFLHVLLGARA